MKRPAKCASRCAWWGIDTAEAHAQLDLLCNRDGRCLSWVCTCGHVLGDHYVDDSTVRRTACTRCLNCEEYTPTARG